MLPDMTHPCDAELVSGLRPDPVSAVCEMQPSSNAWTALVGDKRSVIPEVTHADAHPAPVDRDKRKMMRIAELDCDRRFVMAE